MRQARPVFHLAFTVDDLAATKRFYAEVIGCGLGAESEEWLVLDFFGHRVTAYQVQSRPPPSADDLAREHFGTVLDEKAFHALATRLRTAEADFLIRPERRGDAHAGWLMFVRDPSGNGLEFSTSP